MSRQGLGQLLARLELQDVPEEPGLAGNA